MKVEPPDRGPVPRSGTVRCGGGEFHEAVDATQLTPDDLVRALLVGGADVWRERLDIARELGIRHVAIGPMGDRQRTIREVAGLLSR